MRASQTIKPAYKFVYHVHIEELLKHKDAYINGQELPINKVINTVTGEENIATKETQGGILIKIACAESHVRAVIKFVNKFDDTNPCTVLEYSSKTYPTGELQPGNARVFPDGGIATNKADFPNIDVLRDFERQTRSRQNRMFPKYTQHR